MDKSPCSAWMGRLTNFIHRRIWSDRSVRTKDHEQRDANLFLSFPHSLMRWPVSPIFAIFSQSFSACSYFNTIVGLRDVSQSYRRSVYVGLYSDDDVLYHMLWYNPLRNPIDCVVWGSLYNRSAWRLPADSHSCMKAAPKDGPNMLQSVGDKLIETTVSDWSTVQGRVNIQFPATGFYFGTQHLQMYVCMYGTDKFIKRRTRQVASRPLNRTTKKCRPTAFVK